MNSMNIPNLIRKIIALIIAWGIFVTQKRCGMVIVSFLLIDLFLNEKIAANTKMLISLLFAVFLFVIGHLLSVRVAMFYYALVGAKSFTFVYGFIGGIVELGTYLLLALFPFKLLLSRKLDMSLNYILKIGILYSLIGGLAQGTYNAGWQHIFYV